MVAVAKRMKPWTEKIVPGKTYPIDEALAIVKQFASAKFDEAVDVAVNLGVDAAKSDQQVRGSTVLPHGTGKSVRVAVFTQGKNADAAREAGADIVGMDDLAAQVKAGVIHCTIGKASFPPEKLKDNLQALLNDLQKAKPAASKGVYLRRVSLSSTMGPGVPVDQATLATTAH